MLVRLPVSGRGSAEEERSDAKATLSFTFHPILLFVCLYYIIDIPSLLIEYQSEQNELMICLYVGGTVASSWLLHGLVIVFLVHAVILVTL